MKVVGYRRGFAWFVLADGVLLLIIWFLRWQVDDVIPLGAGVLAVVLGVTTLRRTYFEFHPDLRMIVVKSPLGPQTRSFGGGADGELGVVENRIVCRRSDGSYRYLPMRRFLAKRDEWDSVLDGIAGSGR